MKAKQARSKFEALYDTYNIMYRMGALFEMKIFYIKQKFMLYPIIDDSKYIFLMRE